MGEWKWRHPVNLDNTVYSKIEGIARIRNITVEEWVHEALRKAIYECPEAVEAKLKAIEKTSEHNCPEADIEQMLKEIEAGYCSL